MPDKLDYKREYKLLYTAKAGQPVLIDVPPLNFIMIDGRGDPNTSSAYSEAVEALFSVAYTLKFAVKKSMSMDYAVMPLEGQWWVDDPARAIYTRRDEWQWTMMIMQPDAITEPLFEAAIAESGRKKTLPALDRLHFARFHEGRAAQILHLGPYSEEPATVDGLHAFIEASGCVPSGKHHEIYLNDPRRVAPDKMKTILRQPVAKKD